MKGRSDVFILFNQSMICSNINGDLKNGKIMIENGIISVVVLDYISENLPFFKFTYVLDYEGNRYRNP